MRNLEENRFGISALALLCLGTLCFLVGAGIPIFADSIGDHLGRIAALPAVLLLVILLIFDYKKLITLIILLRSVGDMLLESTQFSIGGMNMGLGGVINIVVIMIALVFVLEKPQLFPIRLARYWVPLLLVMGISVVTSYEIADAIKEYISILSCLAIFIIAVYTVRCNEDFNKIVRLILWSSLVPSIYSLVEIALHMRDSSFRLRSTFGHPNILAFYLTLILVLCLYMLKSRLSDIRRSGRVVICCYIPILLGQLLLTQTRSAWLSCFAVFVVYALLFERKYLLYLLFLPLLMLIPSVYERLMDLGQGNEAVGYAHLNSYAWRQLLWKSAIDFMEPQRLIYGYGLGGFGHFATVFFPTDRTLKWDAHNVYVQFFFDTGIVGLLCYLWLFVQVLWNLRIFTGMDRVSGYLISAVVVQYLIVSYSDNMFRYLVFNWYLWFTVGGACGLVYIRSLSTHASVRQAPERSN